MHDHDEFKIICSRESTELSENHANLAKTK